MVGVCSKVDSKAAQYTKPSSESSKASDNAVLGVLDDCATCKDRMSGAGALVGCDVGIVEGILDGWDDGDDEG
jgi:hypothetical protein